MLKRFPLSAVKILSIAISIWFFEKYTRDFSILIYTIGIIHYVLAAIYSRAPFSRLNRFSRWAVLGLVVLGGILYLIDYNVLMIWVFGAHYMLSEVYVDSDKFQLSLKTPLMLSRFFLGTVVYFTIFRFTYRLWGITDLQFFIILIFAFMVYLYYFFRTPAEERRSNQFDFFLFDFISFGFGMFLLANGYTISHDALLWPPLYHFVFWFFLPLVKMQNKTEFKNYFRHNLVFSCLVIGGIVIIEGIASLNGWPKTSYFLVGYSHILASLAISKLNPLFVRRIFGT